MKVLLKALLVLIAVKANLGELRELTHDSDCNCELPNSDYNEYNYPKNTSSNINGICTTTGHRFPNECWLKVYNDIYHKGAVPVQDSSCPVGCTCDTCSGLNEILNPICIYNGSDLVTVRNPCELQCMQCGNSNIQVIKCGTCDIPCAEIEHRLDCLSPTKQNCNLVPEQPSATTCLCTKEFFPICAIDSVTKNLKNYNNECLFNCSLKENPTQHLLYNDGFGKCFCNP